MPIPEKKKKTSNNSVRAKRVKSVARKTTKKPAAKKTALKASKKPSVKKLSPATKSAVKEGSSNVIDVKGKQIETFNLDSIFGGSEINGSVVYQAVLKYRAGQREGTAATKTRGEVRGGGKKPWKQKGTGQARHGSNRSPIWRGGGVTFGPHPKDYSYTIPSQIKHLALVEAVKDKISTGKLVFLDKLALSAPKTKDFAAIVTSLSLRKPLFVLDKKTTNIVLASRNIPGVTVKEASEINTLDVASHQECVMTKAAYNGLLQRLKNV